MQRARPYSSMIPTRGRVGRVAGCGAASIAVLAAATAGQRWWRRSVNRDIYGVPKTPTPLEVPEGMRTLGGPAQGHLAVFAPPPTPGAPTLVFLHGSGQEISSVVPMLQEWRQRGFGVAGIEYPGYGTLRPIAPTAQRLMDSCEAALREVMSQPGVQGVLLAGLSLGTAPAVELAARGLGDCLLLAAPFTTLADATRRFLPERIREWVPVWPLLGPERIDSLDRARDVAMPALVVHGDRDELFPASMGHRIAAALPQGEFLEAIGADHSTTWRSVAPHVPGLLRRAGLAVPVASDQPQPD